MSYYEEIKSKVDILSTLNNLGFSGNDSDSVLQGDCPTHVHFPRSL